MTTTTRAIPGRGLVVFHGAHGPAGRLTGFSRQHEQGFKSIADSPAPAGPVCRLRGGRIVDRFAADCALRARRPAEVVNDCNRRALEALDPRDAHHNLDRGLQLLQRARTCSDCITRLSGDPAICRLRRTCR